MIVGEFERSSLGSLVGTLVFALLGFDEGLDVGSSLRPHLEPNRPKTEKEEQNRIEIDFKR